MGLKVLEHCLLEAEGQIKLNQFHYYMAADMKEDYILTAYRDHGHALTVGMDPNIVMAILHPIPDGHW